MGVKNPRLSPSSPAFGRRYQLLSRKADVVSGTFCEVHNAAKPQPNARLISEAKLIPENPRRKTKFWSLVAHVFSQTALGKKGSPSENIQLQTRRLATNMLVVPLLLKPQPLLPPLKPKRAKRSPRSSRLTVGRRVRTAFYYSKARRCNWSLRKQVMGSAFLNDGSGLSPIPKFENTMI